MNIMTVFATVEVRSGGELLLVLVGVAIGAVSKFHRIYRFLTLWDMALRTLQQGMLAFEWVGSTGVLLSAER